MATIFKAAQLPMSWFPSVFWDSIFISHFLRWSLSLLAMQSQAFISAPNGYILLLTAPSANPTVSICPARGCQDRFLESADLPNAGRAKQPSPFFTWSTYFPSGSPSTVISALLIHFLLSLPRNSLSLTHQSNLRHTCGSATPPSYWVNLFILLHAVP